MGQEQQGMQQQQLRRNAQEQQTVESKDKEDWDSFMKRIKHLPREDQLFLQRGYTCAKDWYRNIPRESGERYFEHPRSATIILMDEARIFNKEILAAEMMHDVPEESKHGTLERIYHDFGPNVALFVSLVTKDPKISDDPVIKDALAKAYINRLMNCGIIGALIVKMADRLHNARTVQPKKMQKLVDETVDKYAPLWDKAVEIAPSDLRDGAIYLREAIAKEIRILQQRLKQTSVAP